MEPFEKRSACGFEGWHLRVMVSYNASKNVSRGDLRGLVMRRAAGNLGAGVSYLSLSQASKGHCNFAASAPNSGSEIGAVSVFEGVVIIWLFHRLCLLACLGLVTRANVVCM